MQGMHSRTCGRALSLQSCCSQPPQKHCLGARCWGNGSAVSSSGQALRVSCEGIPALTLQNPPRPSSTGVPSACLQTSMSSAHTEGTDHFCMSLKEPSPLPDHCPGPSLAVLPASALEA